MRCSELCRYALDLTPNISLEKDRRSSQNAAAPQLGR